MTVVGTPKAVCKDLRCEAFAIVGAHTTSIPPIFLSSPSTLFCLVPCLYASSFAIMTTPEASANPATSTPSGSLSPSLKRTYDESNDESAQDQDANKRPRVTFDDNVDVRIIDEIDDSKPLEYIRDEVKRGLDGHLAQGDDSDDTIYDQIIELFKTPTSQDEAPNTNKLRKYLQGLVPHVGTLGRQCSGLVHAITDMQWLGRDEDFVGLFRHFLALLLSAHGGYTGSVLNILVKNLSGIPSTVGRLRNEPVVPKAQMNSRLHATLKHLLSVLPSASSVLSSILARRYPASEDPKSMHVNFGLHVLRMVEYAPELKSEILSTIVDRLVKIDVEIQVEMDRIDEDIEESGVLDAQTDDEDENDDSEDDMSDVSLTEEEERYKALRTSIAKIDAVMDLLFTYYDSQIKFEEDESPTSDAEDAMEALLAQFASIILPRHRSRHTQFLVFHFAQRSPQFMDWFEGAAAHLTRDRTRTSLARTNAADYLASFVARGKRVDVSHVISVFDILLGQCDEMRDLHYRNAPNLSFIRPDKTRYGLYYACIQALLYIFCFRWRDLVTNADQLMPPSDDAPSQDLSEILEMHADDLRWVGRFQPRMAEHVYGPLNPLKICNPGIVKQFAHVGRATRFLYVYPLLENNKKIRLHQGMAVGAGVVGAAVNSGAEVKNQLEAYFPFDPYLLPKSKRWLEGDYVEWLDVELWEDKGKNNEEDDDDEGEDADEVDGEAEEQPTLAGAENESVDSSLQGEQEGDREATEVDTRTETDREST